MPQTQRDFVAISLNAKIMQNLLHNLLQTPALVEDPNRFLDSYCLSSYGSNGNTTYNDRRLSNDELQTRVPGLTNLLNNEVLPFLWNKDMTYDECAVMTEHPWSSATALPSIEVPDLSEGWVSRRSSVEVYEEPPIPSSDPIHFPTPPSEEQHSLKEEPKLGVNSKIMTRRQRIAHSQSEKRYRRNLEAKFLQLEDVVNQCHDEKTTAKSGLSKRLGRVKLLSMACLNILELQKEVMSLKRKLQVLREATMPETSRFTIQDEIVGL